MSNRWNYRIFKCRNPMGGFYYEVREVYYNDLNQIYAWSEEPIAPMGLGIKELRADFEKMLRAFKEQILIEEALIKRFEKKDGR